MLVDLLNVVADEQERAIWLISSNAANRGFYEFHGFRVVETVFVGDEDSEKKKAPIEIHIVSVFLGTFEQY